MASQIESEIDVKTVLDLNREISKEKMLIDYNVRTNAIISKLDEENYKMTGFWAQYDYHNQTLLIHEGKRVREKIPYNTLKNILDKEEIYSGKYCDVIKEWYSILSSIVCNYKGNRLWDKKTIAQDKRDYRQILELDAEIEKLNTDFWKNNEKIKKEELAFQYKEEGERLDRLYKILYIEQEETIVKMGDIEIKAFEVKNIAELEKEAYTESKGFFEDINSALELIKKAEGMIQTTSNGESYKNEHVKARGIMNLEINGTDVELEAEIIRKGSKDKFYWNIISRPIELPIEEFIEKIWNKIQDYDNLYYNNSLDDRGNIIFSSEKGNNDFKLFYYPKILGNKILFKGQPRTLKQTIPEVLSAIL
ncbi:MAG: hypothetical protein KAS90_02280 [Candidatus Aenigmarchaeota archaeon]|nr:hypothetical protein [Candidatus Aenigmarchaeota archaeon]